MKKKGKAQNLFKFILHLTGLMPLNHKLISFEKSIVLFLISVHFFFHTPSFCPCPSSSFLLRESVPLCKKLSSRRFLPPKKIKIKKWNQKEYTQPPEKKNNWYNLIITTSSFFFFFFFFVFLFQTFDSVLLSLIKSITIKFVFHSLYTLLRKLLYYFIRGSPQRTRNKKYKRK